MTRRQAIEQIALEREEAVIFADGLDDAIIGHTFDFGPSGYVMRVVYGFDEVIETLMKTGPMSYDDAVEFFNFNIGGAYIGPNQPLYLQRVALDDETLASPLDPVVVDVVAVDTRLCVAGPDRDEEQDD